MLLIDKKISRGLLGALGVGFIISGVFSTNVAGYNLDEINAALEDGINTAYTWDTDCRDYLYNNRNGGGTMRDVINGGASYKDSTWLSGRNTPSVSSPITVTRGFTDIPLQINSVTFLCGSLVGPNRHPGAGSNVAREPNTFRLYNNSNPYPANRWVGPSYANDRSPNNIGNLNMLPARVDSRTRVDDYNITSGGGSIDGGRGEQRDIDRTNASRYWFANPIEINWNLPGGIREDTTLRIDMNYQNITGYNAANGPSRVESCRHPDGNSMRYGTGRNSIDFNQCLMKTDGMRVRVKVREDWSVSGSSGNNNSSPYPTETVTFNHNINVAGSSLSRDITWSTYRSVGGGPYQPVPGSSGNLGNRWPENGIRVANNPYRIDIGTAPGTQICEYVRYTPINWNDRSSGQSVTTCVTVTYYELHPTSALPQSTADEGEIVSLLNAFYVNNIGNEISPVGTDWRIKQVVIQPGNPYVLPGSETDNMSCGAVVRAGVTCSDYKVTGPGSFFNPGNTPLGSYLGPEENYQVPFGTPVGTKICFLTAVDPVTNWGVRNRWSGSTSSCLIVTKSPYLTIMNGDSWAGGNFASVDPSSCAIGATPSGYTTRARTFPEGPDTYTYGSFGEYAVFSLGTINSFGSGGKPGSGTSSPSLAFKRPGGGLYTAAPPVSSLTTHCLQDALAFYTPPAPSVLTNPLNVANQTGTLTINDNVTLDGSSEMIFLPNRRVVLIVNGNVTINKNIRFANAPDIASLASFSLIVSGDINVEGSVNRLDGYYQAKGKFRTCRNSPDNGVNIGACNSTLTINGALNVGRIVAKRTFGNVPGPDRNSPAETIIMRPDVFMSNYGQASSGTQLQTVNETELPPRY